MGTKYKWEKTRYPGVRCRKHSSRKHGVKYDQYFVIRYQKDGKRFEEALGWASEGMSAEKAYNVLGELKEAAKLGKGERSLKERRKKQALSDDANPTLEEASKAFIEHCNKSLRTKTIRGYKDGLDKAQQYVPIKGSGKLGQWKLDEIQRRHIAGLLDHIAGNSTSVAIQVRSSLSALYAWAIQAPREYVQANLVRDIPRPPKPAPRERHLSDKESGHLWNALQTADGDPAMLRLIQFIFLTGCRLSEAGQMPIKEVDGSWWEIPAARFKGKRSHRVYLTPKALELINDYGEYPFINQKNQKSYDPSSVSRYLRRMNYFGLDKFTCHDLRRTVGSGLARLGFGLETIGATLGHKLVGVTAEHYVRHRYDNEKKEALTRWADYLMVYASGDKQKGKVVPLSGKRA